MRIAIIGYGKMGKVIEKLAVEDGHEVVLKINQKVNLEDLRESHADVAIEFSVPEAAAANIYTCFEANVPVVVGTTGWYDQFPEIEATCLRENKSLFYATNFSIGVNIFFEINRYLSSLMNRFEDYNPKMTEIHHTEKKDAPSGTAITLAEGILGELDRKHKWVNQEAWNEDELQIISKREPEVRGTHEISWESTVDTIDIKHTAHSREGFAKGAISAAKWLPGKTGVFTMKDLLKI